MGFGVRGTTTELDNVAAQPAWRTSRSGGDSSERYHNGTVSSIYRSN